MGEERAYLYEFGEFQLDPTERRLMRAGTVVPLTPKAFDTLCVLVENSGHLVEKDRLMQLLWADAFVEEGNLADNISKIRQALGDNRKEPKFIETVSGRGYRFVADVDRIDTREASNTKKQGKPETKANSGFFQSSLADYFAPHPIGPVMASAGRSSVMEPVKGTRETRRPVKTRSRMSRGRGLAVAVALSGLAGFGLFFWYTFQPARSDDQAPTRSMAVLPFKPVVARDRDEALEMGMSDTLISGLSRLRQITVRPISAVRRYADLEQDAIAAGRELGVESVLDGTIQRRDERIRISVRLVQVVDGMTLWTETFDEKFTDIFAVQDSISQKIVSALSLQLSGDDREQLTKKYTSNTEAYQSYLRGRLFWSKLTPDGLQKSLEFYSRAIEIDPGYALAYAGLADSYNLLGSYGFWPMKESHPKARAAAEKALELDAGLAEAHTSLAAVLDDYYWDWSGAERHFKQAISLNPNYPLAHSWYSQHLARTGRLDESVEQARMAQKLDPLSSSASSHVGLALFRARRFDEAVAELQKTLTFDPKALDAHIFLGFVYVQQKKSDDAVAEFRAVVDLSERNPSMLALLAYGYASGGKQAEARAILNEFGSQTINRPVSQIEMAMIHIALGERDPAFEWLEKAYTERAWQLGFLKVEPIFDPLRGDPRLDDLIRRVGLAP